MLFAAGGHIIVGNSVERKALLSAAEQAVRFLFICPVLVGHEPLIFAVLSAMVGIGRLPQRLQIAGIDHAIRGRLCRGILGRIRNELDRIDCDDAVILAGHGDGCRLVFHRRLLDVDGHVEACQLLYADLRELRGRGRDLDGIGQNALVKAVDRFAVDGDARDRSQILIAADAGVCRAVDAHRRDIRNGDVVSPGGEGADHLAVGRDLRGLAGRDRDLEQLPAFVFQIDAGVGGDVLGVAVKFCRHRGILRRAERFERGDAVVQLRLAVRCGIGDRVLDLCDIRAVERSAHACDLVLRRRKHRLKCCRLAHALERGFQRLHRGVRLLRLRAAVREDSLRAAQRIL